MNKYLIRLLVFAILLIVFAGGGYIWWREAVSPANPEDKANRSFVVQSGEGIRSIATRLKNEGIIKDQIGFFILVKLLKLDSNLQAGDFRLNPAQSAREVVEQLTHGTEDIWVTILEGWRNEETALLLAKELSIPESEYLKFAREGYMFPDTYLLPKEASAAGVVKIFEDNFNKRVDARILNGFQTQGLSLAKAVVLASIVEREGNSATDRPLIAGVLLKRLKNDWPLQADATIQYVLGYQAVDKTWWKKALTDADKEIKSPFNTYSDTGLPPTPICNPGLMSLSAVAFPQESDYWYYLHDLEGKVHFARTLEEHNANIEQYLR